MAVEHFYSMHVELIASEARPHFSEEMPCCYNSPFFVMHFLGRRFQVNPSWLRMRAGTGANEYANGHQTFEPQWEASDASKLLLT